MEEEDEDDSLEMAGVVGPQATKRKTRGITKLLLFMAYSFKPVMAMPSTKKRWQAT